MKEEIKPLTWQEVMKMLRDIANRQPLGYCYDRGGHACVYRWEGKPSCIIGHLLAELGVQLSAADEGKNIHALLHDGKHDHIAARFEEQAMLFMAAVQALQDRGMPWRDAAYIPAAWFSNNTISDYRQLSPLVSSAHEAYAAGMNQQRRRMELEADGGE